MLPAASRAVTVMSFGPIASGTRAVQLVVPVAVPLPPRSFVHVTCTTLPPVVPLMSAVDVTRLSDVVGLVMLTVGNVESGNVGFGNGGFGAVWLVIVHVNV